MSYILFLKKINSELHVYKIFEKANYVFLLCRKDRIGHVFLTIFVLLVGLVLGVEKERALNGTNLTPYDYGSILHFGRDVYSYYKPMPTFEVHIMKIPNAMKTFY